VRRCPQGHVTELWYNSCRHRACPRCECQRIGQGLEGWQQQLWPTDHFHLVFTLPSELHELWQGNRQVLTEVLFRCVRETLFTLLGEAKWLGAKPGVLAALHTWGRTLTLHPHVHCLVTGGRLSPEGGWRAITSGYLLLVAVVRPRGYRVRSCINTSLGATSDLFTPLPENEFPGYPHEIAPR